MITLYSAAVCPFAHRTRALLTHLGVDFQAVVVNLKDHDPEFLKLTPTGKVPLFIDGDAMLYESRVINDYIAEKYGFADAYDGDVFRRARQRLAMLQWDEVVLGPFYRIPGPAPQLWRQGVGGSGGSALPPRVPWPHRHGLRPSRGLRPSPRCGLRLPSV